jgi:hypothetical protein
VLGRPGLAPNTIPLQRLVAVGLPARLPGGVQTPARHARALLGQAPKQEGVTHYNRPLAGHGLGAGPGWPQPPFQTRPKMIKQALAVTYDSTAPPWQPRGKRRRCGTRESRPAGNVRQPRRRGLLLEMERCQPRAYTSSVLNYKLFNFSIPNFTARFIRKIC